MFTYTVSELCQHCKGLLESEFPDIWVKGEISNLARPASGHIYFSLKDETAQIRCALFRFQAARMKFKPEEGDEVLAHGKMSLYTNRGDFQMICDNMEPVGIGALQKAFEQLREKLEKEGLFDISRKRIPPRIPTCIGVITSRSGAAVRDILRTLERRFPSIPVILYPSLVQGEDAAQQLIQVLKTAQRRNECDVLILGRGGGSIEDLWAFNDEKLAREVAVSEIPIISGVGHENDFTIVDYVADVRASTPTAAAEAATPDSNELRMQIDQLQLQAHKSLKTRLHRQSALLDAIAKRFKIPKMFFSGHYRLLEKFRERIIHAQKFTIFEKDKTLQALKTNLVHNDSLESLSKVKYSLQSTSVSLETNMKSRILAEKSKLQLLAQHSHAISPMPTLARGYSILSSLDNNKPVLKSDNVKEGELINNRVVDGNIISRVVKGSR